MRMILQGNTARDRETVRERDQEREKQKVCVEERRVPSREKDHGVRHTASRSAEYGTDLT